MPIYRNYILFLVSTELAADLNVFILELLQWDDRQWRQSGRAFNISDNKV